MKTTKDAADDALKEMFSLNRKPVWKPNKAKVKTKVAPPKDIPLALTTICVIIVFAVLLFTFYQMFLTTPTIKVLK